mgnify:FL=1
MSSKLTKLNCDQRDFARRLARGCAKYVHEELARTLSDDELRSFTNMFYDAIQPGLSQHQNVDRLRPMIESTRTELEIAYPRYATMTYRAACA